MRIAYTLSDQPAADDGAGHWLVSIVVSGLDPTAGAPGLASTGWGWPADWPYFELLESEPPLGRPLPPDFDGSSLTLAPAPDWDGRVRVLYRLQLTRRGSDEQRRFGLAPSRGAGFAYGNSSNVLMRASQAGELLEGEVTVEISASGPELQLVTGWGGQATGRQRVTPDRPWGTSPIVFGAPTARTFAEAGGFAVECYQWSGADATARTAELTLALVPAMARAVDWPARNPARVFLSDAMGAGMGGEYGLHMNAPAEARPGWERTAEFETTLAHELFHEWLGGHVHESHGSLVWFREGFTEYFAQWFCAAQGVISRETFAETLEQYDRYARRNTSLGRIAFADPGVNWRDGDGPNELMAYRAAPVLALALDVQLRAAGKPGLLQLVRDLLAREQHVFPPDELQAWFVAHGLERAWRTSIAGREVPTAAESLLRAGFEPSEVPVDVAYLGLQAVERKPTWEVLAVDPEGPAAAAGVQVGDIIDGFFPFNGAPTRLAELDTPYTFGLAIVTPGIAGAFLEIRRDGAAHKLMLEPEPRPWGLRTSWRATPASDTFFSFVP